MEQQWLSSPPPATLMFNTTTKIVKCLLWNPCSIIPKKVEFENFVEQHKPSVLFLAETCLTQDKNFSLQNYRIHRYDRVISSVVTNKTKNGGGVAILIHNSIQFKPLSPLPLTVVENIAVEIELNNTKLTLVAIYNTPTKPNPVAFAKDINLIISKYNKVVIAGDFNAKHRIWNCTRANSCGNALNDLVASRNNLLLNFPDQPTHFRPGTAPSTIDLILSKNYSKITNIKSINDLSSHHYPILFNLEDTPVLTPIKPNIGKIDWNSYREFIDKTIIWNSNTLTTPDSIDSNINYITDCIKQAVNSSSPPISNNFNSRHPFSQEVKDLVSQRNRLRRVALRTQNRSLRHPINQLTKQIKYKLDEITNTAWKKTLLDIKPNHTSVWKLVKRLKNRENQLPPLTMHDKIAYTNNQKANLLAHQFHQSHHISLHPTDPNIECSTRSTLDVIDSATVHISSADIVHPPELRTILKNLRNRKAPGHDNLPPILIKNLPKKAVMYLLAILNACLRLSYFPTVWKHAKVIAIKKPNKPSGESSSYRPISLLPILGKIFEKIIYSRILSFVQTNNILNNQQFGFREGHSAQHQLVRLGEHISTMANVNRSTGLVMLDIEKAFDSVWHAGLLYKLHMLDFPCHLLKIIKSYLYNRSFNVNISGELSVTLDIPSGVPQGSILSPILFNLFTNDLPTPPSCKVAVYADDTAIYTSVTKGGYQVLSNRLTSGLNDILQFFKLWKIKVNTSKTEAVLFTHSNKLRKKSESCPLVINNIPTPWRSSGKYLGCTLDTHLTFQKHIKSKSQIANKAIYSLFALFHSQSSLNQTNKLLIYKVAIRPILTYACALWENAASTNINHMQVVQNKCLRYALSLPRRTPIHELHKIANIPTISQFINKLTNKFYSTTPLINNPLISTLGNTHPTVVPFRIKHKMIRKF